MQDPDESAYQATGLVPAVGDRALSDTRQHLDDSEGRRVLLRGMNAFLWE